MNNSSYLILYCLTFEINEEQEIKIKILQNGGPAGQPGPQAGRKPSRGVAASRGSSGLAWTDRGTCAPLPFHVTGGQPAVGQGVVIHTREGTLLTS
ncbi:unnamed protein product [Spirodela intermedia]|uniref:Uncharacterized protein n=1 Tax=Spirodela intermedia TaxID=51605 RepID=A0ABN7E7Y6_SPIIN|nr:unnamed protein product [Spirodela intermedia]